MAPSLPIYVQDPNDPATTRIYTPFWIWTFHNGQEVKREPTDLLLALRDLGNSLAFWRRR
jgi:hypothetical protein